MTAQAVSKWCNIRSVGSISKVTNSYQAQGCRGQFHPLRDFRSAISTIHNPETMTVIIQVANYVVRYLKLDTRGFELLWWLRDDRASPYAKSPPCHS
jgi:hypothetical protein